MKLCPFELCPFEEGGRYMLIVIQKEYSEMNLATSTPWLLWHPSFKNYFSYSQSEIPDIFCKRRSRSLPVSKLELFLPSPTLFKVLIGHLNLLSLSFFFFHMLLRFVDLLIHKWVGRYSKSLVQGFLRWDLVSMVFTLAFLLLRFIQCKENGFDYKQVFFMPFVWKS